MYNVLTALISLVAAILIIINAKMKRDMVEKEIKRTDEEGEDNYRKLSGPYHL